MLNNTQILTIKQYANLLGVHVNTASRIYKKDCEKYDKTVITMAIFEQIYTTINKEPQKQTSVF